MIFDGYVSAMTLLINFKLTIKEKYLAFKIVNN